VIRINRWAYAVCGAAVALALAVWGIHVAVRSPFGGVNRTNAAPLPGTVVPAPSVSSDGYAGNGDQASPAPGDIATADPNPTPPPNPGVNPAPPMPPAAVPTPPPAAGGNDRGPIHW
jgi:hypothetical protein